MLVTTTAKLNYVTDPPQLTATVTSPGGAVTLGAGSSVKFVDATDLVDLIKVVKSAEELDKDLSTAAPNNPTADTPPRS